MRKVVGQSLGSIENFQLTDSDVPAPGVGEVRIKVEAVGLGYVDGLIALGRYQVKPPLPFTPGGEVAGIIDEVGPGVTDVQCGDRVAAWTFGGGLADYCLAPAAGVQRFGGALAFDKAAALLVNYSTAYHALADRAQLAAGETVLVLGAAGGTGIAAIEIAVALGARVIAAASTPAKRDLARSAGAADAIDYTDPAWRQQLKALCDGRGPDVVFDPVGGDTFEPAFRSLAWRGRHLVIGFAGGPIRALPANLPLLKGAALVGVDFRQFSLLEAVDAALARAQVFQWAEEQRIQVPIGTSYRLDEYDRALAATMDREVMGKTVVTA